jgi:stage II sporulation protein R
MKKIIVLVISIIIGILVYRKNDEIIIPSDAIRIRIIANSNNISDIYQKKLLKEDIKNSLYHLFDKVSNTQEADEVMNNNLNTIKDLLQTKTNDYRINYGLNYFPKKVYKGVIYPEGYYKSLVVTLGKGLGDNWWCVLYPPLCFIDESNINDEEYSLFIKDLFSKYLK